MTIRKCLNVKGNLQVTNKWGVEMEILSSQERIDCLSSPSIVKKLWLLKGAQDQIEYKYYQMGYKTFRRGALVLVVNHKKDCASSLQISGETLYFSMKAFLSSEHFDALYHKTLQLEYCQLCGIALCVENKVYADLGVTP
jgi:hypothetical protein